MNEIMRINDFTKVCSTLSKLVKTCIMRFTSDNIYYVLSERGAGSRITAWCELQQAYFFSEYNMDGVSPEQNEIFLEVMPENILQALKSAQTAKSVKIKLTKNYGASLTFEIELPTMSSRTRLLTHDVPVTVVQRRFWEDYEEPSMPNYDISLSLPPLKVIKNVVDRMKKLGTCVVISATRLGELKLQVETEIATVSTHFKELEVTSQDDGNDTLGRNRQSAESRIDIRKFSQLLTGQQIHPTQVLCNILHGRLVHFCMVHEGLTLQYYLPAISA